MLNKLRGSRVRHNDYVITTWWRGKRWNVAVTLDGEKVFERGNSDPHFTQVMAEATGLIMARRHERLGGVNTA